MRRKIIISGKVLHCFWIYSGDGYNIVRYLSFQLDVGSNLKVERDRERETDRQTDILRKKTGNTDIF